MLPELHHPLDGYYQGTRFDRSGVFKSLVFKGREMCGEWFEAYSPTMHDAVLGPAEEFSVIPGSDSVIPGSDRKSHILLKPGVGLIDIGTEPYERFRLYKIVDPGRWEVDGMRFRHIMEGYYDYTKEITVTGENSFRISHRMQADIPIEGDVYNHNFFTFGKFQTSPSRRIDFPFTPEGTWRAEYDSVGFTESGIRFSRQLQKGESVYTGNIHEAGKEGMPYEMSISEGPLRVHIRGDVPATKTVLWANHRIACLEPYNKLSIAPGQSFCWNIEYEFFHE
ncbi:MAG: hypothetical protein IJU21_00650 [Bacteroidales bacterium]|nr:hypothetical protein [Bacteroidales bacterium]